VKPGEFNNEVNMTALLEGPHYQNFSDIPITAGNSFTVSVEYFQHPEKMHHLEFLQGHLVSFWGYLNVLSKEGETTPSIHINATAASM
jgi:hypothetical protein